MIQGRNNYMLLHHWGLTRGTVDQRREIRADWSCQKGWKEAGGQLQERRAGVEEALVSKHREVGRSLVFVS